MNNTNRALNRIGIFLFGLVVLVLGAAAALAAAIPGWFDGWKSVAATVGDSSADVVERTTLGGLGQSWLLIAIPAACVVLIVLLVVSVFRQGHGRTQALVDDRPVRQTDAADGAVIVDGKVAEESLQHALDTHPGIVSSDVSTFDVKRTPVLRITVNVRRGISPSAIRTFVDDTVAAWDSVLGREVPVLVQINAGIATRLAKTTRVLPGVEN